MAEQDSKALIERYFREVRNGRNHDAARQLFADDVAVHVDTPTGQETVRGAAAIRETLKEYASGVSDLHFTVEDQIAEGDKVVVRWQAVGNHRGEMHGVQGTGKRITFGGIDIFRVANGKIAEGWTSYDRLSILQQIGAAPGSAHPGR